MESKIKKNYLKRLDNWKNKAKERGAEVRALRKKVKVLEKSRDMAKEKLGKERSLRIALEKEGGSGERKSTKVKNHSYDLETMAVCLAVKQGNSISLRSCRGVIATLCLAFGLSFKVPSVNTIRNWDLKQAYNSLESRGDGTTPYAIIVDESFSTGGQSLLLLLGVKLGDYGFDKSLSFKDVEVLGIAVNNSWKADNITRVIKGIEARGYRIVYGCGDGANNITKSLKDSNITRIYDCTHAFALLVKKEYEEGEEFKAFLKKYSLLNRQNYMGKDRAICPPKLKGKSRFLNIYRVAEWAEKHLAMVEALERKDRNETQQRIYQKLVWLKNHGDLITELSRVSGLLKAVLKVLKNGGLSQQTIETVEELVSQSRAPLFIRVGIRQYLQDNKSLLSVHERVICCSDIIESCFGKFKYEQSRNPNGGITIGCLKIANYRNKQNLEDLKKAMEQTRIVELKDWSEKNKLQSFKHRKEELAQNVA